MKSAYCGEAMTALSALNLNLRRMSFMEQYCLDKASDKIIYYVLH